MPAEDHHVAYLWIIGLVFVVAVAGAYVVKGPGSPTGNVAYVPEENVCDSCEGDPVCAVKGDRVSNYENACAAACDGARVLANGVCEHI